MATKTVDLVVIGTGSAATAVAFPCRAAGWTVAVIDSRPFGGTCALRGCDPKKVLVGAAELVDWFDRMRGKGVQAQSAGIDWSELMRFKRTFTDPVPQRREASFAGAGIATYHGRARFVGPTSIQVGEDRLDGRRIVVATGAAPMTLPIPGAEHLTTSDRFLELDELPSSLIFVGGGYISFEFAHLAARVEARVTVLHRGSRPLERFDPALVEQLVRRTRELGVDVQLDTEVTEIRKADDKMVVTASSAGKARELEGDMVVHGAGRVPEIEDLDLGTAGIEYGKQGVLVNEYLQSRSNPAVYAAGDAAAGGPPLTPVAGYEGEIVAANLLHGNHRQVDYRAVPSVVFTIPPLAAVGLLEPQAREAGLRVRTHRDTTSSWYSSRRVAERSSGFNVLVEEGSERILGAHILGPHAEEVINLFALAIQFGLTAKDLSSLKYAYPTHASDIWYMLGE
ncbi:dihydrolipoyl dehydrogenase family protein [Candidatus Nitrospira bockiana]